MNYYDAFAVSLTSTFCSLFVIANAVKQSYAPQRDDCFVTRSSLLATTLCSLQYKSAMPIFIGTGSAGDATTNNSPVHKNLFSLQRKNKLIEEDKSRCC
jgi:hypothetical protein